MKSVCRSLLLWLVLLAIPFQGVASAGMLLCAMAPAVDAPMAARHDHAAMLAAARTVHGDMPHDAGHAAAGKTGQEIDHGMGQDGGHAGHGASKCGTPGACCVGVALAPTIIAGVPALAAPSLAIPFRASRPAAVDLAHPERPPQSIPA